MTDVCCAIVIDNLQILAVQRGLERSHPLKWEFPGGKINIGETAAQCIQREIKEELCVTIQILNHPLSLVEYDYGNLQICLIPFLCKITSGELNLTEHTDLRWLKFSELNLVDWAEADRELIEKNRESLKTILQGSGK